MMLCLQYDGRSTSRWRPTYNVYDDRQTMCITAAVSLPYFLKQKDKKTCFVEESGVKELGGGI